jgi:hypothetical protein
MRRSATSQTFPSGKEEDALISEIQDMIGLAASSDTTDGDAAEYLEVAGLLAADLDGLTRSRYGFTTRIGQIREERAQRRRAAHLAWRDRPHEGQSGGFFGR